MTALSLGATQYELPQAAQYMLVAPAPSKRPRGSIKDRSRWLSYADTIEIRREGWFVGFVVAPEDPYFFLDIDDCIDAEGRLSAEAQELSEAFEGCYQEISPSGKGIHIIGRTRTPLEVREKLRKKVKNPVPLELYTYWRCATLAMIEPRGSAEFDATDVFESVAKKYFSYKKATSTRGRGRPRKHASLSEICKRAQHDDRFTALWEADGGLLASYYPPAKSGAGGFDHSSADFALACKLIYYGGGEDTDCIRALMLKSQLNRQKSTDFPQPEKWDSGHPYLDRTIDNAFERQQGRWKPRHKRLALVRSLTGASADDHPEEEEEEESQLARCLSLIQDSKPELLDTARRVLQTDKTETNIREDRDINATTIFEAMLHNRVGYCVRRQQPIYLHNDQVIEDHGYVTLMGECAVRTGVAFNLDKVRTAVVHAAEFFPVDRVKEYLESLKWDGTPRVHKLFAEYFRSTDNAYTQKAAICFLVGAVARVMKPGCQVDCMPVLHGRQGIRKSSGLKALFGAQHFADRMPDPRNKDAVQYMLEPWLVEIAELSAIRSRSSDVVKNFLSSATDRVRMPYARLTRNVPRKSVFAATTNDSDSLKDSTGGRRYWPIDCTDRIDVAGLQADRDQLWAEAVSLYLSGEPWHIDPWDEAYSAWTEALYVRSCESPYRALVEEAVKRPIPLFGNIWGESEQEIIDGGYITVDIIKKTSQATNQSTSRQDHSGVVRELERLQYSPVRIKLSSGAYIRVWKRSETNRN